MIETSNYKFIETSIKDLYIIECKKFNDNRGYFMETYKKSDFEQAGLNYNFIQDNQSCSTYGVLRGLHFQKTYPQAKLVRCIKGSVLDVAVDLRPGSETYGKYEKIVLTENDGKQFMIPRGFAHGFLVLTDTATFCYKCDELYHADDNYGIRYDDPDINIAWPEVTPIILSDKDKVWPYLRDLK